MITPNSDVILLKCPIELSQQHQLTFANATAQYNYFNGLTKLSVGTSFTYQRKDGTIRVPQKYDDIIEYNYVMYRNDNYSNKWFYAFIEGMEYVNDGMTAVNIKTDVYQTWMFQMVYKNCFVEREHVNDDTIGKNTIPEGLNLGEYLIVDHRDIPLYDEETSKDKWIPCFCVSALPEGCVGAVDGRVKGDTGRLGGVFNALKYFATYTMAAAKYIIEAYEQGSVNTDAIINIYMVPRICIDDTDNNPTTINGYPMLPLKNYVDTNTFQLQQPTVMAESYTPVNKKLYTYPYSYVYMSNNVGEDITFNWEDFPLENISGTTMPTMTYYKAYVPSTSISAKLIFKKYKTYVADNTSPTQMMNYGMTFAKVPVCAWTTDYYTNWLTQNGVNVQTSIGSAIAGMAVGAGLGLLTGGVGLLAAAGSAVAGFSSIANTMAEVERAKSIPDQAHGNVNTGDLVYALKRNSISCYYMSIRKEVAQSIDSYFSMFGYKVNKVKTPNVSGRRYWNYVKTIGSYIEGNIPQDDLREINSLFDNGITLWHDSTKFLDYSQSNTIVS